MFSVMNANSAQISSQGLGCQVNQVTSQNRCHCVCVLSSPFSSSVICLCVSCAFQPPCACCSEETQLAVRAASQPYLQTVLACEASYKQAAWCQSLLSSRVTAFSKTILYSVSSLTKKKQKITHFFKKLRMGYPC